MRILIKKHKYIIISVLLILISNCDMKSEDLWKQSQNYYKENDFANCTIVLNKIINNNTNQEEVTKAKYLLSEIYLNEYEEYYISIKYLQDIVDNYPEHNLSKKSIFTIAYIYGNYLDSYTDSFNYYKMFLDKYPNDELSTSAKYEIDNLEPYLNKAKELLNN